MSVRPIDAWKRARGGTEVHRGAKKEPRATDRRARTKRREKNISAGAKARERKKNHFGGSEKKFWRQREHNPQKKNYVQYHRVTVQIQGGPGGYPPDKM